MAPTVGNFSDTVPRKLLHLVIRLCDKKEGFGEGCLSPEESLRMARECSEECEVSSGPAIDGWSFCIGFIVAVIFQFIVRYRESLKEKKIDGRFNRRELIFQFHLNILFHSSFPFFLDFKLLLHSSIDRSRQPLMR